MARRPPADPDALGAFYKRWTPYEDQRRNISDDLKTLFAELKARGLTPKSARIAFAEKYRVENQTADEADKRAASDEEVELYLSALARVRESDEDGEIIEDNEPADREHISGSVGKEFPNNEPAPPAEPEESGGPSAVEGAGVALPADTQSTAARKDVPESSSADGSADSHIVEEPGNAVAHPQETASVAGTQAPPVDLNSETPGAGAPAVEEGAHNPTSSAVPGSTRTERTPIEGLVWHEYLRVWPEVFGRDFAELVDDVRANGVREPIIMQGNIVLDGRARYLAAREALVEYSVQEYAGDDPLRDIIAWNMAARKPHLVSRQMIAKALIKLVPDRADEIGELLDLSQQREAAQ